MAEILGGGKAGEFALGRKGCEGSDGGVRYVVLGSGSGGNAAVVEGDGVRLLVDAGLSAKQLCLRMEGCGVDPGSLSGILLTHEHGDHVAGLRVLAKKLRVPVYATASTAQVVRDGGVEGVTWKIFESGAKFRIGSVEVESFLVPHDAVEPVGFVFRQGDWAMGLLSDSGHVTRLMIDRLRGVRELFVEANYDVDLLEADEKRPWSTKQRISSRHGHLSNEQTAELVGLLVEGGLQRVVLGHLSRDCNHPGRAIEIVKRAMPESGVVICAEQERPCGWWSCESAGREG